MTASYTRSLCFLVQLPRNQNSRSLRQTVAAAAILLDLTELYDYIGFDMLLDDCIRLQFPLHQVLLSLEVFMAPRFLTKLRVISEAVEPSNGILAGCGRAIALIRAFLHSTCSTVIHAVPRIGFREFVDDLSISDTGDSKHVINIVGKAGSILVTLLRARKCVVSPKKVILASKKHIQKGISAILETDGCDFAVASTARDAN